MSQNILTLDVRPDFRAGDSPCNKIHSAIAAVRDGDALRLLVPFEPVPIYEVARSQGLGYESREIGGGDWEVLFGRDIEVKEQSVAKPAAGCGCGCHSTEPRDILDVDARGLEPPQPMVKILEALTALPDGATLRARTDRRPVHLYPLLESRGFTGQTEEQSDGSCITIIRRS